MEKGMMKALVFKAPKHFDVEERPIPSYGEDELLVKVRFGGVCGTDNRIYQGTKVIQAPRITGHEFSGTIAGIGAAVKGYHLGQRVSVYPMIYCGKCHCCLEGRTNICVNRTTIGYEIDGGFAQYVKIPKEAIACGNVVEIPDNVSDEVAAISEPIAAAYHGIQQAALRDGDTFVIVGAGPIGLFHVQLSKSVRLGKLIVIEPIAEKREMAREMGADIVIDPVNEDAKGIILDATDGRGADSVIIDVGVPSVLEQSIAYVKKGGRFVIFAGNPVGSTVTLDPNVIHYKELVVTGSSSSSADNQREVFRLLSSGKVDCSRMVSGVFPLEDWQTAFEMKANYKGVKTILDPWKE
ncbi:MAG: threonine dehydrogenase [Ruminococcaceae bacterium]|nr:threonine dehydrogenase [Oscillospiraceae bacterium]